MILNDWKRLVLVLLCSPLVQGAGAQEKVTLSQCYEWARANYPQVRQYRLIEQTEQYNLSNAAKGWLPQLAVNAKATYQSDVTKLPFDADKLSAIIPGIEIPTLSKDQYQVVAEVNQTIWDGGVIRSTRRLTEAQATADREQLNSDLYILNDRVNQLYFGCLLQDELIRQNGLLQKELQINIDRISAMMENGVANQRPPEGDRVEGRPFGLRQDAGCFDRPPGCRGVRAGSPLDTGEAFVATCDQPSGASCAGCQKQSARIAEQAVDCRPDASYRCFLAGRLWPAGVGYAGRQFQSVLCCRCPFELEHG